MSQIWAYFKTKTDVAQNLTDNLEYLSIGKTLIEKKYGGTVLISEKTEAFYFFYFLFFFLLLFLYKWDPHKKISEILSLHSGVIVVLSNKSWELTFFSG